MDSYKMIALIDNRKKLLLVISVILLIFIAIPVIYLLTKNNDTAGLDNPAVAGNPPSVVIVNDNNSLYNAFVYSDYDDLRKRITDYVISKGGDGYSATAYISDVKTPFREGSVTTFNMKIPSINQNVKVEVNIPPNGDPSSFSIPSENYFVPLNK